MKYHTIDIITENCEAWTDGLPAAFVVVTPDHVMALIAMDDGSNGPRIGQPCALEPVEWSEFWRALDQAFDRAQWAATRAAE